jgi:rod shape-determining protein MreD
MSAVRGLVALALVSVALVLQVTLFPHLAWAGIVPNLVLLVVVAAALARGAQFAAVLGFVSGLLLDLAPPADHVAGRWALALVLVGYLAGRVRQDVRPSVTSVIAMVAGSSFVGTSIYALTGILLRDPVVGFGEFAQVIGVSVVYDILLTPLVMPWLIGLFWRLEPDRALA